MTNITHLDWSKRPENIQLNVNRSYKSIKNDTKSQWGYFNGDASYSMCRIDERGLLKNIIRNAPSTQREFHVLDVGAGNFQWIDAMARIVNEELDLPEGIKVHLIGIRGERYNGAETVENGRCVLHYLGHFKIEEMLKKFPKRKLFLENSLDLVLSRWCFRHLTDPVGTFAQLIGLIRKSGYFLGDGFYYLLQENIEANCLMIDLLFDAKVRFLMIDYTVGHSLNQFILQRADENPCQLPMSYQGVSYDTEGYQIGSGRITRFERASAHHDFVYPQGDDIYFGDKSLYLQLRKMGVFYNPKNTWQPLLESETSSVPDLHRAVLAGDKVAVEQCLTQGAYIDEPDAKGNTALHLAVQMQNEELFNLLFKKGARLDFINAEGDTLLHVAARCDFKGGCIDALIEAGVDVNSLNGGKTAMSLAIDAKNILAVTKLIAAKATLSSKNLDDLREPPFKVSRREIPDSFSRDALGDVCKWILRGDCVVLHERGFGGIMYYRENVKNNDKVLYVIDLNPDSHLLNDGEWPYYIKIDAGVEQRPLDKEFIDQIPIDTERELTFGYPKR